MNHYMNDETKPEPKLDIPIGVKKMCFEGGIARESVFESEGGMITHYVAGQHRATIAPGDYPAYIAGLNNIVLMG